MVHDAARPPGRLCDRSIANALTPLRLALDAAVAEGLLAANPAEHVVLPRRRAGRAWSTRERRFLMRAELLRLLDEVAARWRALFELLAATGLRISEAIGLRWSDLVLDEPAPHPRVRRSSRAQRWPPKSRHGARLIPLAPELAATLRAHRPPGAVDDTVVLPGRDGGACDQGSLRRRVLVPAAERAGLTSVGFHTLRHTCASMLIESGLSPLHLQRLDGPPLARVHARDLRAPDRRRPRTRTRPAQGAPTRRAMSEAARRARLVSLVL